MLINSHFSLGMAFTGGGFLVYFFSVPYQSLSSWLVALAALICLLIAHGVEKQINKNGGSDDVR